MDITPTVLAKMEIMMFDQLLRQEAVELAPARPDAICCRRPCVTHLKMSAASLAGLALALAMLAVPAHAQSSSPYESSPSPSFNQTLQTPEQQTRATAPVPSATAAPPEYRVGMGDVLGITVYNMPELDRTAVVGSAGALMLSYFPQPLGVSGMTAEDIGQQVASKLKQLQVLLDPQVSATVLEVESKPVVVGGDVRNPQVLQEVRPLTLQEALMLVGGPQAGAGDSVLVTRTDGSGKATSYDLPLSKVLAGTDPKYDIPVKPGDTIQVLAGQKVYVAGAVKNPGAFSLGQRQSLTVSKLMALTGGWKPDAKPADAVIVREGSNGQRQTLPLNLTKIMARKEHDVALEANDLVYVPDSTGKKVGLTVIKGVGGAAMLGAGYLIIRQ
jgi:polysaccharide biosynthesis/export protein